jgi:hypothetical protein
MVQGVTHSLSADDSRRAGDDKTPFARRRSVHDNGFICWSSGRAAGLSFSRMAWKVT